MAAAAARVERGQPVGHHPGVRYDQLVTTAGRRIGEGGGGWI